MGEILYTRHGDRPRLRFCRTCNARDRAITRDGLCSVCGNDPTYKEEIGVVLPGRLSWVVVEKDGEWSVIDKVILVGLIVATIGILIEVARWPI